MHMYANNEYVYNIYVFMLKRMYFGKIFYTKF